jgi:transcriptional regulator EpsA
LPHDIFVAMVGDFESGNVAIDIVSALPKVRTGNCVQCGMSSVAKELYDRWSRNGYQLLSLAGELGSLLGPEQCPCPVAPMLAGAGTMLAHGLRDSRSGEDALYLLMHPEPILRERQRRMFAMLLPQIDFACRRVVSLGDGGDACHPSVSQEYELTAREVQILNWIRVGKTNEETGHILNISAFTVKNHLQRIYRKMNVMNRAQAVAKLEETARRRLPSGR